MLRKPFQVAGYLLFLLFLILSLDVAVGRLELFDPRGERALNFLLGVQETESLSVYHPYMLYTTRKGYRDERYVQINSLGYRNEEFPLEKPPGEIRVLCLGGSTTFAYPYVRNPRDSWCSRLREFAGDSGIRIFTINGGLSYATSAELLSHYMFRHRHLKPDYVIIHTGLNDSIPLFYADYNREYTHFRPGWTQVPVLRPGESSLLRSNIVRSLYSVWLSGVDLPAFLAETGWRLIPPKEALANVRRNEPVAFRSNLDLLLRNIKADGAEPILFDVVLAPKEVARDRKTAAYIFGHYDALKAGMEKNEQVMDELQRKYALSRIKIASSELSNHFLDHCHVSEAGEAYKAEQVARILKPLLLNQAL